MYLYILHELIVQKHAPTPHQLSASEQIDRPHLSRSTLFAYGSMIKYDPTLVDLRSNLILCTNMKAYIIIYSGWSLA